MPSDLWCFSTAQCSIQDESFQHMNDNSTSATLCELYSQHWSRHVAPLFKGDLGCFFFSFPCMRKILTAPPTGGPLSHRKHFSWNASSVAIFNYVTLWFAWFVYVRIDLAQQLCCGSCCWLRCVGADQSERTGCSGGGGLKETGAKTECFRQRGRTELLQGTVWELMCLLSTRLCKPALVVTQNKIK